MIAEEKELSGVVETIRQKGKNIAVWTFSGDLGAGKTTLIKELCRQLKVKDRVKSPTFNLVHEYVDGNGDVIYHFDFYRVNDLEEAQGIGLDDYFFSGSLCLIEWPGIVEQVLPRPFLEVKIAHHTGKRIYDFLIHGQNDRI